MISLRIILILLVLGALIISGILEVQVHPERVGNLKASLGTVDGGSARATIETQALLLKRRTEQWFIKDERRRTELALLAVKDDINTIRTILEQPTPSLDALTPKIQLLNQSLARVDELAQEVSIDTLASMKAQSHELLQAARELHEGLARLSESTSTKNDAFTEAVEQLNQHLNLGSSQSNIKTEETTISSESNSAPQTSALPLTF